MLSIGRFHYTWPNVALLFAVLLFGDSNLFCFLCCTETLVKKNCTVQYTFLKPFNYVKLKVLLFSTFSVIDLIIFCCTIKKCNHFYELTNIKAHVK